MIDQEMDKQLDLHKNCTNFLIVNVSVLYNITLNKRFCSFSRFYNRLKRICIPNMINSNKTSSVERKSISFIPIRHIGILKTLFYLNRNWLEKNLINIKKHIAIFFNRTSIFLLHISINCDIMGGYKFS